MTSFTYYDNVPNPPDNPSEDVPLMLQNTKSIYSIWDIDHVGFDLDYGGTHLQNTYLGFSDATVPADVAEASLAYPAAGIADSDHAQYYFDNALASFPLSAIKAFGSFTSKTGGGSLDLINGYNISSTEDVVNITQSAGVPCTFTIVLEPSCVIGTNIVVFIFTNKSAQTFSATSYTFTNASPYTTPTLVISTPAQNTGVTYNFAVLQI